LIEREQSERIGVAPLTDSPSQNDVIASNGSVDTWAFTCKTKYADNENKVVKVFFMIALI
jgi:hypothetical protein